MAVDFDDPSHLNVLFNGVPLAPDDWHNIMQADVSFGANTNYNGSLWGSQGLSFYFADGGPVIGGTYTILLPEAIRFEDGSILDGPLTGTIGAP